MSAGRAARRAELLNHVLTLVMMPFGFVGKIVGKIERDEALRSGLRRR